MAVVLGYRRYASTICIEASYHSFYTHNGSTMWNMFSKRSAWRRRLNVFLQNISHIHDLGGKLICFFFRPDNRVFSTLIGRAFCNSSTGLPFVRKSLINCLKHFCAIIHVREHCGIRLKIRVRVKNPSEQIIHRGITFLNSFPWDDSHDICRLDASRSRQIRLQYVLRLQYENYFISF